MRADFQLLRKSLAGGQGLFRPLELYCNGEHLKYQISHNIIDQIDMKACESPYTWRGLF